MMVGWRGASHHLLMSLSHIGVRIGRLERESRESVDVARFKFLIAMLALAAAAAPLCAEPAPGKRPKEVGRYSVTISGYYSGTGTAIVNVAAVILRAELTDDDGNTFRLQSQRLRRDSERHNLFRGEGTLNGMKVAIDGRIDPPDDGKSEVLRRGRIVFTFKVLPTGYHGRGVGEKNSGSASSGGGGS